MLHFALSVLLSAPPGFGMSDDEHSHFVSGFHRTAEACVGRNADGEPIRHLSVATTQLRFLSRSLDRFLDQTWGKPEGRRDPFFPRDVTRTPPVQALRALRNCAEHGNSAANAQNNFRVAELQARGRLLKKWFVNEPKAIARQVRGVRNSKNPACGKETERYAKLFDEFAELYEQEIPLLIRQCTEKLGEQGAR